MPLTVIPLNKPRVCSGALWDNGFDTYQKGQDNRVRDPILGNHTIGVTKGAAFQAL